MSVTVIGSYLSPYVRKVLACLHLKGIAYRIDPIIPFYGDDAFTRVSPLRRIPVLLDGDTAIADSTVICEYLDERWPNPPLYPTGAGARARARWLEEFADSRLGDVLIWRLFNEVAIRPHVWGRPTDRAAVQQTIDTEIPPMLDYLEGELPADGWQFGAFGVADIAIASFFRNAAFARYAVDAGRWPRTAAFVSRALGQPAFAALRRFEERMLRTPIAAQRDALITEGAPVAPTTFGTATPRRGPLSV